MNSIDEEEIVIKESNENQNKKAKEKKMKKTKF